VPALGRCHEYSLVIPLPATVRLDILEGGTRVDADWDFDQLLVSFTEAIRSAGIPKRCGPPASFTISGQL
jgi:hypothetical protein